MENEIRIYHHKVGQRGRKWTVEIMAGAVYAIKDAGLPVNPGALQKYDINLLSGMVNYPGGYDYILGVAGLDPNKERLDRRKRLSGKLKHEI